MGKKKKEVTVIEPQISIENVETVESTEQSGIIDLSVVTYHPTIYDRMNKYIIQSQSNYLSGISQPEIMEILRYCERILNKQIPLNVSCSKCMIDLIKLFANLKNY